jgi:NACHT domain
MLINIGDVVDGALVNAIALAGRRISVAVDGMRGRRRASDLTAARWFETYRLTEETPDLPDLSPALTERLAGILRADEIQAALQELLAARLTDAPETDAASARQVLGLSLAGAGPAVPARLADALAEYYDDQICALVARVEADDPRLLAQVRSEAFSTRMINVLNAIERHTAALQARPARRTEAAFLASYRRHVIDQHGKLEPPDFDRRRRVPIADIYVPTVITEDFSPERAPVSRAAEQSSLTVYDLAGRLDRFVLLGDPGGGKTTAAHVLMHHFALDASGRVPFLVTLRDYAATDPPSRSVVGYIEHVLETFYQCPAPAGLADLLLLTGRAVVIFDGLDELLDTSRRADVTTRVERFCAEYPLAPVLITSRVVGYEQARLDDRDFACYRLGGFGDDEVAEYVRKWFAQDADARPEDARAFLAESAGVRDLRSNPLLLSLMCILYRGAGSLPRDRAGLYEQCADLLFRRWDARRRIHMELRAGHLVEPALRHLAWWLFTGDNNQPAVTERDLVAATAAFLYERGFESEDDARAAAREFVEFCRGRMWVFSDAGTTASGERLYAFTHRTFGEYFAAAQLAYVSDTPEELASALVPLIVGGQSWVVAELAVQIKDRTSNRGAPRLYAALLSRAWSASVLRFLALCLRSVDPSPQRVRDLTRQLFEQTLNADRDRNCGATLAGLETPDDFRWYVSRWASALESLLANCGSYRDTVADEIGQAVGDSIRSGGQGVTMSSLRLVAALADIAQLSDCPERDYWAAYADQLVRRHAAATVLAAADDAYLRHVALDAGVISVRQALDMPGGPGLLFRESEGLIEDRKPYFYRALLALDEDWPAFAEPAVVSGLAVFGEYLIANPEPPWLRGKLEIWREVTLEKAEFHSASAPDRLSQAAYLGAAAILAILSETRHLTVRTGRQLGPLQPVAAYLDCRPRPGLHAKLPELQVPDEFKAIFREWAEGAINFVAPD